MSKFGEDGKHFIREDCTDEAIDRTLARLETSQVTVIGDTAKLTIHWDKDDGNPNPVFGYRNGPVPFRRTPGGWRIDANAECAIDKPEVFFAKGSWGSAFRTQTEMMDEISSGVEAGSLKSIRDVISAMEKHVGSLEGRTPLTRPILYEEDSPARYLRIGKGDPGTVTVTPAGLPHREDVKNPTRVEGNLQAVFENIYHHAKIIVETTNNKGYEVVFGYDDNKALEIVAKQLGMTVGREERQIFAMVLTVGHGGHRLQEVKSRGTPEWQWTYTDRGTRAYHGVTMDELAQFLEDLDGRPVANNTGSAGYYSLELSNDAERCTTAGRSRQLTRPRPACKFAGDTQGQKSWSLKTSNRSCFVSLASCHPKMAFRDSWKKSQPPWPPLSTRGGGSRACACSLNPPPLYCGETPGGWLDDFNSLHEW